MAAEETAKGKPISTDSSPVMIPAVVITVGICFWSFWKCYRPVYNEFV